MKKFLCSDFARIVFAIAITIGLAERATAAAKKDARVTQVVKDVRLLASNSASRPAAVNEPVGAGTAVRTGGDSRAELTFTDQTIARLGANTVFSYGAGAKDFDLGSGAILVTAPKNAGTTKINAGAATAAITGFTALIEHHGKSWSKFLVLEGQACIRLNGARAGEPCLNLSGGEMLLIPPAAQRLPAKQSFDVKKVLNTSRLVKGFSSKLPNSALNAIQSTVQGQQNNPPSNGFNDPTGTDAISQKNAAPPPKAPPPPPPG
jgi:FecR protein